MPPETVLLLNLLERIEHLEAWATSIALNPMPLPKTVVQLPPSEGDVITKGPILP